MLIRKNIENEFVRISQVQQRKSTRKKVGNITILNDYLSITGLKLIGNTVQKIKENNKANESPDNS